MGILLDASENFEGLVPVLADKLLYFLRPICSSSLWLSGTAAFLHGVVTSCCGSSNNDHLLGEVVENTLNLRVLFAECVLLILQMRFLLSFVDTSDLLEYIASV